ncbi:hypothetical protein [Kocuria rosea]|uniref:hypothetical protein n=1 Tax=Kocuria rosea TaxID=1275 RepID=UPI003D341571
MSTVENLGEQNKGVYRWTSDPDRDGDTLRVKNNRGCSDLVFTAGNDKTAGSVIVTSTEARSLALAILDLLDGECPTTDQQHMEDH